MKRFLLVLLLVIPLAVLANDKLSPYNDSGKFGFKDAAGNVVVPAHFDAAGSFSEGLAAVKSGKKWGFIDHRGDVVIPISYDEVGPFSEGRAWVRNGKKVGYINPKGDYVIAPLYDYDPHYSMSFKNGLAVVLKDKQILYLDSSGREYYNETAAKQAVAVSQPFDKFINVKLGTLENYMKKNNVTVPNEDEIIKRVQNAVETWQVKGEFESTAQYNARVNDQSRKAKANEIAKGITSEINSKIEKVRNEYMSKFDDFAKVYCDARSKMFKDQEFALEPYDADNQTFLIKTEKSGDILLPVPINEAQNFKNNWENIKKDIKAVYVPVGNDVALQSISFGDYVYDSNTKANYGLVEVDYNFNPIDINSLDYDLPSLAVAQTTGTATVTTSKATPTTQTLTQREVTPQVQKITAGNVSDIDTNIPQGNQTAANTFAVIIANGNYDHASKVTNAENDGRLMEKYMIRTLGIPERNITTYINATYGQMATAMNHLKNISEAYGKDNFSVVFYYVGHGLPDDNNHESFMLPVDVDPKNIEICYPLNKLYTQLGDLGAKTVTVLIDACFSGSNYGAGMLIAQSMGVSIKPKDTQPIGNMIVLSASQGDETAFPYEEKGHGLFTYWFLKKLQDSKGNLNLGELADYVKDNVRKTSVVVNRKPQTPNVAVSPSLVSTWRNLQLGK